MGLSTRQSLEWFERANVSIPGGVSSPVRAFQAVGGHPRYFVRGEGSHVYDADGNGYIDLVGSWGPMIVGHAHPHVVEAVHAAVEKSFSFGAPSPHEVLLAEEITSRVACIDQVRFVSSGTEAVMTALHLARASTNRSMIVKFAGCYHGHVDSMLVAAGSGVVTLGLANSPGVTPGQAQDTLVLPYNDLDAVTRVFEAHGSEIAAVITESAPANMGVVPPIPGFTEALRTITRDHGALLILDEVMTGFRVARDGWWGAFAKDEGIVPDLFTYGKVIGGGFPVAAVAGKKEIMELLAPVGSVYQAGTLSGNPVATSAGLATLQLMTPEAYDLLNTRARQVGNIFSDALSAAGVEHSYQHSGNLFSFFFTSKPVYNFDQARTQNAPQFAAFFHALLEHGVSVPPSAFEAWFVSTALTDSDLEKLEIAAAHAAKAARV
jgi:glutamate-1-semialdehyde 2,1-aminomutase